MPINCRTDRIEELRQMILELANGNFAHRLKIQTFNDDLQGFEILMNLLAEELGGFLMHSDSFNERNITNPFVFVIDTSFKIRGSNERFHQLLGYKAPQLLNQPISDFMKKEPMQLLRQQLHHHIQSHNFNSSIKILLHFKTHQNSQVACWGYCHWISDGQEPFFLLRGLPIAYTRERIQKPFALEPAVTYNTLRLQADIQRIREVHQYVLENLHCKLPTLKEIAVTFQLNEFKLKTGFKELYNTTVFKLHLEKRLERAMLMVQHTPTSIHVVATSHGFKSLSHFSRAFKARFGENPTYFKKKR